ADKVGASRTIGLQSVFIALVDMHRRYFTPSRLAFSRMANSSTAAWLMLSFWASNTRSRFASELKRMLVNCFVFVANIVAQYELPGIATGNSFLCGLGTCQSPCVFACSSRRLRLLHPEIAQRYYQGVLWSSSYFAASCGGAPLSIIRQYVENQRQNL